jgi:hypothetical protein
MAAEKVLVYGGNSAICSNSPYTLEDFIDFDWIGPPWTAIKNKGDQYVMPNLNII